ncbi:uncharacterized protein N7511_005989 [Penicillium nucicola]|uniref:uncharacterized protein n=1 Tax=Penicillium nucicola TaxID=1850975 RepID=UPI002545B2C9|nr:uncharacterized protein N7511_005989 [Penicillium nucicola]KAJ5757295.1 hypothetical protein N7511_005989 [Penicillium nucicola]
MKLRWPNFLFCTIIAIASATTNSSALSVTPSPSLSAVPSSSSGSASLTAFTGNTASSRQEWRDYDINTDYTTIVPQTNITREYWFNLEYVTVAPDGPSRSAISIYNSIPGPTIKVNWGDEVIVHLTNSLPSILQNGTSIHFHGIRQFYINQNDGAVSITQCPTAPNKTITYKWRAMQYGTSWYHSHIGLQAWEELLGGIVINVPASADYDEDKGVIIMNDWNYNTVDQLFTTAKKD